MTDKVLPHPQWPEMSKASHGEQTWSRDAVDSFLALPSSVIAAALSTGLMVSTFLPSDTVGVAERVYNVPTLLCDSPLKASAPLDASERAGEINESRYPRHISQQGIMLPADDQAFIAKVDNSLIQIAWACEDLSRYTTTNGIWGGDLEHSPGVRGPCSFVVHVIISATVQ